MAARKSAAKKTTARKSTAKKTTARKSTAEPEAAVQTTEGTQDGPVVVPAGGIDPRLVEQRDKQREAEEGVRFARASEPATLDPKLAEIRDRTIKREAELADRSTTKAPARG